MGFSRTSLGSPLLRAPLSRSSQHKPITDEELWELQLGEKARKPTRKQNFWGAALTEWQKGDFTESSLSWILLEHPNPLETPKFC